MTTPRLSGLTLTGFQVFETRTQIPLNRLTLMFGPNSAGKSAVADALRTIFSMFDYPQTRATEQSQAKIYRDQALSNNEFSLLRPHWRRVNSSGRPYAPLMEIDLDIECSSWMYLEQDRGGRRYDVRRLSILTSHRLHRSPKRHAVGFAADNESEISSGPVVQQAESQDDDPDSSFGFDNCHSTLALEINGSLLISASTDGKVVVNLGHDSCFFEKQIPLFRKLCLAYPEVFSSSHELLTIEGFGALLLWENKAPQLELHGAEVIAFQKEEVIDSGLLFTTAHTLQRGWEKIWFFVSGIISAVQRDFQQVNASRVIPSREELTFLRLGDELDPDFGRQQIFNRGGGYASIAFSLARESGEGTSSGSTTGTSGSGRQKTEQNAGEKINDWLTGYLFRERGYRLGYNRWDLEYSSDLEPRRSRDGPRPYLVELLLRDERGVALEFTQVGSGIGYVFPVLAALSGASSLAWVEQPELHLHPALQCELGDVVLDAMNRGVGQCIVETHSEHFLLRVLRRIRESFSQDKPIKELRWHPKDLAILYFEPNMDGSSAVRRLRVDEDGEFLDRWPQGFFSERDRELFRE